MPDHTAELGPLIYSLNPGCAGAIQHHGSAPSRCPATVTHSVEHVYRYPKPQRVRLLVCEQHAQLGDNPEPITAEQQANLDTALARRDHIWKTRLMPGQL